MESVAAQSLMALQSDIHGKGDEFQIMFVSGHNVLLARTLLVKEATKREADYVLFLDSDHVYSSKALYTLISKMEDNDFDILSAAYRLRGKDNVLAHGSVSDGKFSKDKPGEGIKECDVIGLGFAVFKHSLVCEIVEKYDTLFWMDANKCLSEDAYFCRLLQEEGIKIRYDADTMVGHLMTTVIK